MFADAVQFGDDVRQRRHIVVASTYVDRQGKAVAGSGSDRIDQSDSIGE